MTPPATPSTLAVPLAIVDQSSQLIQVQLEDDQLMRLGEIIARLMERMEALETRDRSIVPLDFIDLAREAARLRGKIERYLASSGGCSRSGNSIEVQHHIPPDFH